MPLSIKPSLLPHIPSTVQGALSKLSTEEQSLFETDFESKYKSTWLYVLLAIFFPIQLFLLGKIGMGVAFLLTMGGGSVWYVVEIFMTPKRVREYNADIATRIMRDMKIMNG